MRVALARAEELIRPPPAHTLYSVALDGSEQAGRSKIYRNWQSKDELLTSLDPKVSKPDEYRDAPVMDHHLID